MSAVVLVFLSSLSLLMPGALGAAPSLETLDAAANVLVVLADGERLPGCALSAKEAQTLLLPLRPRIEERLASLKAGDLKAKTLRGCAARCHCGVYLSALERMPGAFVSERDGVEEKARELEAPKRLACARRNVWFCKSRLLRALKREAPAYQAEGR